MVLFMLSTKDTSIPRYERHRVLYSEQNVPILLSFGVVLVSNYCLVSGGILENGVFFSVFFCFFSPHTF